MGREAVSGPSRSAEGRRKRKKRPPGLAVVERDGFWHISGTLRVNGRSKRIRKSTELEARPDTRGDADAIRLQVEQEARSEIVHGVKPSVPVAVACDQYSRRDPPIGAREIRVIKDVVRAFPTRSLATITEDEWAAFVEKRNAGNAPATRERYLNALLSFLNWCRKKPRRWLQHLPEFDRSKDARKPKHRRARRVNELTPELVMMMMEEAAPHFAVQIATECATGARVSSLLYHCRLCDYHPERGQIIFQDSKNGDPVAAALPAWTAPIFQRYLAWRGGLHRPEAPLFLTHRRAPYADNGKAFGGQNKSAWLGMKRRTVRRLVRLAVLARRTGDLEMWQQRRREARLIATVTQHWFRHKLATEMQSRTGDLRATMDQIGWRDPRSALGYTHDVPERRRALVESVFVDTSFTRDEAPIPQAIDKAKRK